MEHKVNDVWETKDYAQFIYVDGNRMINALHLKRIMTSMKERYIPVPALVDAKTGGIIDGQHRWEACRVLQLPFQFIRVSGYNLADVQRLNAVNRNWSNDDFLNGWVDLKYAHYIRFKEFRDKYGFSHRECVSLLTKGISGDRDNTVTKEFREGNFVVTDLNLAYEWAEKILEVEPYYKGFRRRSFVMAMMKLFKHPLYKHDEFIKKLTYQSQKLVDQTNVAHYMTIIEEIYNFQRKAEDKVRFY